MRRLLAALLSVAAAAGIAQARRAPLADWIDADAPVVVSLRPDALAATARLTGDAEAARAAARAAFAFDLFDEAGWRAAGLDRRAPILISLLAIDEPRAAAAFTLLGGSARWDDRLFRRVRKTYFRSRAVLAVADCRQAVRAVEAAARARPELLSVAKDDAHAIALLLGARPSKTDAVVRQLRGSQVVALGWLDGVDALVVVRVVDWPAALVIDVLAPFAGVPIVWPRDGKTLLGLIKRRPGAARAAVERIAGAGLGLWIEPGPLLDANKAAGRAASLRALVLVGGSDADRAHLARVAGAEIDSCEDLRELATAGPVRELSITVDVGAAALTARAGFALRPSPQLHAALAAGDDLLIDAAGLRDAVAAGALHATALHLLRALPRPPALGQGLTSFGDAVRRCGAGGAALAALFGWPHLLAAVLDDVAALDPALAAAVDGARNAVFALKSAGGASGLTGAAALSFEPAAARAVEQLLDGELAPRQARRLGGRAVTTWAPSGAWVPFAWAPADGRAALGAGAGDASVTWLLSGAPPRPADRPLLELHADLPALLPQLGLAAPAAFGRLRATAALRGDTLAIDATLELGARE